MDIKDRDREVRRKGNEWVAVSRNSETHFDEKAEAFRYMYETNYECCLDHISQNDELGYAHFQNADLIRVNTQEEFSVLLDYVRYKKYDIINDTERTLEAKLPTIIMVDKNREKVSDYRLQYEALLEEISSPSYAVLEAKGAIPFSSLLLAVYHNYSCYDVEVDLSKGKIKIGKNIVFEECLHQYGEKDPHFHLVLDEDDYHNKVWFYRDIVALKEVLSSTFAGLCENTLNLVFSHRVDDSWEYVSIDSQMVEKRERMHEFSYPQYMEKKIGLHRVVQEFYTFFRTAYSFRQSFSPRFYIGEDEVRDMKKDIDLQSLNEEKYRKAAIVETENLWEGKIFDTPFLEVIAEQMRENHYSYYGGGRIQYAEPHMIVYSTGGGITIKIKENIRGCTCTVGVYHCSLLMCDEIIERFSCVDYVEEDMLEFLSEIEEWEDEAKEFSKQSSLYYNLRGLNFKFKDFSPCRDDLDWKEFGGTGGKLFDYEPEEDEE